MEDKKRRSKKTTKKTKKRPRRRLNTVPLFIMSLIILGIVYTVIEKDYNKLTLLLPMFFYNIWVQYRVSVSNEYSKKANRSSLVWNLFLFFTIILISRIVYLQAINSERYSKRASNQALKENIIVGERGQIFDSDGKLLAYTTNEYTIIINPRVVAKQQKIVKALEYIDENIKPLLIDPSYKNIKSLSEKKYGSGYKVILKKATKEEVEKIVNYLKKERIYIGSAITIEKKPKRKQTESTLTQIIGYVGQNKYTKGKVIGVSGIENTYENYLEKNVIKREKMYTNKKDMELPIAKNHLEISGKGRDIYLTIDSYIQYVLSEEVYRQYQEKNATEAVGLVMDPSTGKILGAVSYERNKGASVRTPVIQNQYEPGSTFKPVVGSIALDEGVVTTSDTFDVGDGYIMKYGHRIKEASRTTRGVITFPQIFEKSSNVGMTLLSDEIEPRILDERLRDFGIGEKTGVDIFGEVAPRLQDYKKWNGLKRYTMAFGQGVAVTPLQLATAFSAVINGGKLYEPYIVEKVVSEDGSIIRRNIPKVKKQVITEDTSKKMKYILQGVVEEGGGHRAGIPGYHVGGKTGTAQISGRGGYIPNEYLASFIGFFPVENPKYVILTMFLKPEGRPYYNKFGGVVSAPVFKRVASRIIKHENIKPMEVAKIENLSLGDDLIPTLDGDLLPDLTGKSTRTILKLFKEKNITLKINGKGIVESQKPKPGTPMEDVKEVEVYLKE